VRSLLAAVALVAALVLPGCGNTPLPEEARGDRDVAAGQRIFQRKCASCHNANGDGRTVVAGHFPYANLVDGVWRSDGSPAAIEKQIRKGRDPMPRFEGKLTDEEIRQTVAYVVALSRSAQPADPRRAPPSAPADSAP
jgi:mono/diheme cytochrome c family protein